MKKFSFTKGFMRDLAKIDPKIFFSREWTEIIDCLSTGKDFSEARRDHPLHGKWKGCRDCHIKFDLVLIYERRDDCILFHHIGTHSELDL